MQLTKCRGEDGIEHFVLDGRVQLPGADEVQAYQLERVQEVKGWLGEALGVLQLDQPYSPFVAEVVVLIIAAAASLRCRLCIFVRVCWSL